MFPFLRVVSVYKGYPGAFNELADVDVLLVGIPLMVEQYQQAGLTPHLVYHAFDADLARLAKPDKQYQFTFLGSSGYSFGLAHLSRYVLLRDLMRQTPLQAWLEEKSITPSQRTAISLYNALTYIAGSLSPSFIEAGIKITKPYNRIHELVKGILRDQQLGLFRTSMLEVLGMQPLQPQFSDRCHPALFGNEMYAVLGQSALTFNKHTDAAASSVGNLRLFQATGMGACLISDSGKNMADLFEPDREIVTYASPAECLEKIKYLLVHPDDVATIARAGQERTLRDHSILRRCQQIDVLLQAALSTS